MDFFANTFKELPDYQRLIRSIHDKEFPVCMTGLSSVHKAQLALTISTENTPAVLLVTGTEAEAIKLCADINAMSGENIAMYYPTKEILYTSAESRSVEYEHERLHVLSLYSGKFCQNRDNFCGSPFTAYHSAGCPQNASFHHSARAGN